MIFNDLIIKYFKMDKELCHKFVNNPKINPSNGKRLIKGKGPHRCYVNLAINYKLIEREEDLYIPIDYFSHLPDDSIKEIIINCDDILMLSLVNKRLANYYNNDFYHYLYYKYFAESGMIDILSGSIKTIVITCCQLTKICLESQKELGFTDIKTLYQKRKIGDNVKNEIKLNNLPLSIGILTNLTTINFRGGNSTMIPKSIGKLINLSSLDLSDNKIKIIPDELGNCINLKFLNLSKNHISSLPDTIINLSKLSDLLLTNNNLSSLPSNINNLKKLCCLNVNHNNLINISDDLINLINDTKIKRTVIFDNNKITTIPLTINNQLTYISLLNNPVTVPKSLLSMNIYTNMRFK